MRQGQELNQELRLQTRITQQQLRFVRMLEMNPRELEEAVECEIESNPALERAEPEEPPRTPVPDDGVPYYRLQARNRSLDDRVPEFTAPAGGESLYEHLMTQVERLDLGPEVRRAAEYAVGNIDPNGYLRRNAAALADDMLFSTGEDPGPEVMARAIDAIKGLDPAGTGAADLRECMLLQLRRKPRSATRDLALRIVEERFADLSLKHHDRLPRALHATAEETERALAMIRQLNPKPGAAFDADPLAEASAAVTPDFVVEVEDGGITIEAPNAADDLRIVESFANAMARLEREKRRRGDKEGEFIRACYTDARDFIGVLRRRQETLFGVMTAIAAIQKEYLLSGDERDLKPMALKDVAERTGMDLSVISRATNNKYVALPHGVVPLRFFFSEAFGTGSGGTVSGRGAEAAIRSLVENEDKNAPLSDEALRLALAGQGYVMSRRTVAKYRDRLKIPVWRLRRVHRAPQRRRRPSGGGGGA